MRFVPTMEQKLIQESAREFAKRSLKPLVAGLNQSRKSPADIVRIMAENDFMGMFLPDAFGGAEAGYSSYLLVIEELSRVCAGVASILVNHSAAVYAIQRWGSAEQKQSNLPALASGENLGAFAIFEDGPEIGNRSEER